MDLFSFLLETKDLEGTNCERRIDSVLEQGSKIGITYKLKSTTGKFDAHRHRYTEEQINYIKQNLKEHLNFFGYTTNPGEENPTGYFDFGYFNEYRDKYMGFKKVNEDCLNEVTKPEWERRGYEIDVDGAFDVFSKEEKLKLLAPAKDFARK